MIGHDYRQCGIVVALLLFAGGAIASPAMASRRSGQLIELLSSLPVRKSPPTRYSGNDPFALLAAFPQAVSRRGPVQRVTLRVRAGARPSPVQFAMLQFAGDPLPRRNEVLSSGFGMRRHPILGGIRMHAGVDLAAPTGTPVFATADGLVGAVGRRGGYGLSVTLEHGQGLETRYAHMSHLNVQPGQRVRRGDVIGRVGSTGLSTGPHLHYETLVSGAPVNPLKHTSRRRLRGR